MTSLSKNIFVLFTILAALLVAWAGAEHRFRLEREQAEAAKRAVIRYQKDYFTISRTKPFGMIVFPGYASPVIPVDSDEELHWKLVTPKQLSIQVRVYKNGKYQGTYATIEEGEFFNTGFIEGPGKFQLFIPESEKSKMERVAVEMKYEPKNKK